MRDNYLLQIAQRVAHAIREPEQAHARFERVPLRDGELKLFTALLNDQIVTPTPASEALIESLRDAFAKNRTVIVKVPL